MPSDTPFFQVASGLIPVLFIAVAMSDRFNFHLPKEARGINAALALGVIAFFLLGEIFAIELSFAPGRPGFKVTVVVGSVALAAVFAGSVVAWPIVSPLHPPAKLAAMVTASALCFYGIWGLTSAVVSAQEHDVVKSLACMKRVERTAETVSAARENTLYGKTERDVVRMVNLQTQMDSIKATDPLAVSRAKIIEAEMKLISFDIGNDGQAMRALVKPATLDFSSC